MPQPRAKPYKGLRNCPFRFPEELVERLDDVVRQEAPEGERPNRNAFMTEVVERVVNEHEDRYALEAEREEPALMEEALRVAAQVTGAPLQEEPKSPEVEAVREMAAHAIGDRTPEVTEPDSGALLSPPEPHVPQTFSCPEPDCSFRAQKPVNCPTHGLRVI